MAVPTDPVDPDGLADTAAVLGGSSRDVVGDALTEPVDGRPDSSTDASSNPSSGGGRDPRTGQWLPGTHLAGRYRIVGPVGQGGMGVVYRADDLLLGQAVALKFLPRELAEHPGYLARLLGEVRTAREVSHPHVCRVHDVGEADGQTFLSMEYVEGEDLRTLARRIGRLPSERAAEVARQLCAGLHAAHQQGVLHRDLKPANVMLDRDGRVRIMDFGLAVRDERVDGARAHEGTPAYMAPEQLEGREATVASDLYALGLVLYELFTGRRAFPKGRLVGGESSTSATPAAPSTLVDQLDPAVERVIMRCLEPRAEDRPSSALAVAAGLPGGDPLAEALAAGEVPSPELVAAAGSHREVPRWIANLLLVVALVGLVLSLVTAARTSSYRYYGEVQPPDVLTREARRALEVVEHDAPRTDWGVRMHVVQSELVHHAGEGGDRWAAAERLGPHTVRLWYRQAPRVMVPGNWDQKLEADDPDFVVPGDANVVVDGAGRLVLLRRLIALGDEPPAGAAVQLEGLLELAQIDPAGLSPTESPLVPPDFVDRHESFLAAHPFLQDARVRVEVGHFQDQVVWFRVVSPWEAEWGSGSVAGSRGGERPDSPLWVVLLGVLLSMLVAMAALAVRSLRRGEGDRRGAARVAAVLGTLAFLHSLAFSHLPMSVDVVQVIARSVMWGCTLATLGGAFYLVVEPQGRRLWPQILVSWSRLIRGQARDPLVARDVLIGVGAAVWIVVLAQVARGQDGPMPMGYYALGGRHVAGLIFKSLSMGVQVGLMLSMMLIFFRLIVRHEWIAAAGYVLFAATQSLAVVDGPTVMVVLFSVAQSLIIMVVLLRVGMLAIVALQVVASLLVHFPVTLNPEAWHFGYGMVAPVIIVALVVFAYFQAVGPAPRRSVSRRQA